MHFHPHLPVLIYLDDTPTPRIYPMLGEIPLKNWQCIAEFIDNKIPDTQFELSFDDIKSIERIRERIHLPNLIIKPDEDNYHCIVLTGIKDKSSPEFTLTTYHKTNRDYEVRCAGFTQMPILISNYKVSIFKKFILLESKDIPLKYLIALEPKPTPDSKEDREIINYYAKN